MPRINGIQLLRHQNNGGCAIDINNKAVFSANLSEFSHDDISTLAGNFFEKPCTLQELYAWTRECVSRVDLSHPLSDYSVKGQ
jgi:hypothetical protein